METLDKSICALCTFEKKCRRIKHCGSNKLAVRVIEQFEQNRIEHFNQQTGKQAEREMEFATTFIKDNHRTPTFSDAIEITRNQMIDIVCDLMIAMVNDGTIETEDIGYVNTIIRKNLQ